MIKRRQPAPPKKGRIKARKEAARRAVARKATPPSVILGAAEILQLAHAPEGWPIATAAGLAAWYGRDRWDALRERRSGGQAAARRRRRFQGTATAREIRGSLSAGAARKQARVTRPSLGGRIPAAEAGIRLGKGGTPQRSLMVSHEDVILLVGAPRTGKTSVECGWLAEAPGAVISTTTRTDTWVHTAMARARKGPLWVLNPDGDGDLPSNFCLSPLTGCHIPQIATESAGYLQHAAPSDKAGKDQHWDAEGADLLRLMMHAAALTPGADMRDVYAWVRDPMAEQPLRTLAAHPDAAHGWARELAELRARDGDYLTGVIGSARSALRWMADPFMAMVACPEPGDLEFSAAEFIESAGTLYLIAADKPHGSVAPYCAWMTAHIWSVAKRMASRRPGGRLDPPLTMVLDEPAITCPVPIDKWSAEAGGHGVTIITGVQSPAQLAQRWGEHGAKTIRDNATVKLILRGRDDHAELEALSAVCGERDTWHHSRDPDGRKTRQPGKERLFPPERIRTLKPWQAVLLHRSTRPLLAWLTPVWKLPGYQPAPLGPALLQAQAQAVTVHQPAIEAPAPREAIPMPGAKAPAIEDRHPVTDEEIPEWLSQVPTSRSAGPAA